MVAAIPSSNSNAIDHLLWGDDVHRNVSKCKHNALKSYSHHDSKGYVYSFHNLMNIQWTFDVTFIFLEVIRGTDGGKLTRKNLNIHRVINPK